MVKKLSKFLAYTLFFILALIAFTPKSSLYFLLEENLKKFDVIVSKERLKESFLTLHIENLEVSAKGIESAAVENADVTLLLFYNTIHLKNIALSSVVDAFVPPMVQSATLSYTVFNPLEVTGVAKGDFGEAEATFNLLDTNVTVVLQPSKTMLKKYTRSLREFKKNEKGEYIYAKTL